MSKTPVAKPELGSFEHPRYVQDSRPESLFTIQLVYSYSQVISVQASGVELRDGCFLIAKPRLVTRCIQGEWTRFYCNEVFKFVNIVEVVELNIVRDED